MISDQHIHPKTFEVFEADVWCIWFLSCWIILCLWNYLRPFSALLYKSLESWLFGMTSNPNPNKRGWQIRSVKKKTWASLTLAGQKCHEGHYMGVSKNMGKPPNHPFVHRVFHYFHHPFWGFSPYFWFNTHIIGLNHFSTVEVFTANINVPMAGPEISRNPVWIFRVFFSGENRAFCLTNPLCGKCMEYLPNILTFYHEIYGKF